MEKESLKLLEIELLAGSSIEDALSNLKTAADNNNCITCANFNGKILYSTDDIDIAYMKVTRKTKDEHDKYLEEKSKEYKRKEEEHKEKIPELTEKYCELARGLVLDNELDYWDKIVPIRLGDLYHGMELEQTLDICRIMRDETLSYDERLRKAYDLFMESGHSGMSAGLTASMIRRFCPDGADVADAVMDFRFEEHKKYD